MTTLFTETELKAREMLEADRVSQGINCNAAYVLRSAFAAAYHQSRSLDGWLQLAEALQGGNYKSQRDFFQSEITAMVKRKLLRSRRKGGVTLYEINY